MPKLCIQTKHDFNLCVAFLVWVRRLQLFPYNMIRDYENRRIFSVLFGKRGNFQVCTHSNNNLFLHFDCFFCSVLFWSFVYVKTSDRPMLSRHNVTWISRSNLKLSTHAIICALQPSCPSSQREFTTHCVSSCLCIDFVCNCTRVWSECTIT